MVFPRLLKKPLKISIKKNIERIYASQF